MNAGEILGAMTEAFEKKGCPGAPIAVAFDVDDGADVWSLTASSKGDVLLESGEAPNAEFTIVTTTELLRRLFDGEISPMTAAGRENLRQKAPLDFHLPEGAAFSQSLYHRIVLFVQRFLNPIPAERVRISKAASRVVHGGHAVALFADVEFRSAWYLLEPGEQLNEEGDTNPFPQAFVILSGSGTARIGDAEHELEPNAAYYVAPNCEHVVKPSSNDPLTLLWMAWGEGA
jgi:mannose-6-phosphate isomerase-like protein (cupin superfamily)